MTKLSDLINPEVMVDAISADLEKMIKFAPYAVYDNELEGMPGDTITRPRYAYIGPAEDLEEGVPMDPAKMTMTTSTVTVKEAGKAVEITEKAIITNLPGTEEEAKNQIGKALSDKVDIDYLASMAETELHFDGAPTTATAIIDAIALFGDEEEEDYILFINPADYRTLYKSMVVGNTHLSLAELAELIGLKAIERTKRVAVGTAYIQKQGAVEIVVKKAPDIKVDDDILARTVVIAGNHYYTTNLYNEAGVVKVEAK